MSEKDNNAPTQDAGIADNNSGTDNAQSSGAAQSGKDNQPDSSKGEEMVSLKKSDYEAWKGRQAALDKKETRLNRLAKKFGGQKSVFNSTDDGADDSKSNDSNAAGADGLTPEDHKAERGLIKLALKPEYRELLDANPMLRDTLTENPLSLLPLYAREAVDAQDAVELIEEHLEGLKAKMVTTKKPDDTPAPAKPKEETPNAGGENANVFGQGVAREGMNDKEYTENLKRGDTKSVANALKHRLTKSFKK